MIITWWQQQKKLAMVDNAENMRRNRVTAAQNLLPTNPLICLSAKRHPQFCHKKASTASVSANAKRIATNPWKP